MGGLQSLVKDCHCADSVCLGSEQAISRDPSRTEDALDIFGKISEEAENGVRREACPDGCMCPLRQDKLHLREKAHPFDPDYIQCCEVCEIDPQEASLRSLFRWVDVDGSNKVSRSELEAAIPLLSRLFQEEFILSQDAWERLDEDGNGTVNFSEFSSWAGPRLGLPLGVKSLFDLETNAARGRISRRISTRTIPVMDSPCGIVGCPCEAFTPMPTKEETQAAQEAKMEKSKSGRDPRRKKSWKEVAFVVTGRGKERLLMCRCGHKHSAHRERPAGVGEVPYPHYWSSDPQGEFMELIPLSGNSLGIFQELLTSTYKNIWTRDRRKHSGGKGTDKVPNSYEVVQAWRCENSRIWREYVTHRATIIQDRDETPEEKDDFVEYTDVKSTLAWAAQSGASADRLIPECNEWYLFHGTSPAAAQSIAENDFKISLAGGNTGTLYGRGAYLAESITKADEYARCNEDGEYAVLLCRALGGRVKYTEEISPDPEYLVRACIEGPFDCILGDREKCRNTYREFVFYDTENLYVEYIIHYKRHYLF